VAFVSNEEIDKINILQASFLAMNNAVKGLSITPELLLIDGNRFKNQTNIPFQCVVKGDSLYQSIAAASILAKTYRDDYMQEIHNKYPQYQWNKNMGYPTKLHRQAIEEHGITPFHRKTFRLSNQLSLF
jgi:ribonuclease HII